MFATGERLLLRIPGLVPFETCICSKVETFHSWTCHVYGSFEFRTSLGTSIFIMHTNIKIIHLRCAELMLQIILSATKHWLNITVESAVHWAHFAIMANHGQNCCAGSRTYVEEAVYDKFVEMTKAQAQTRVVGDPFEPQTQQGPQVRQFVGCIVCWRICFPFVATTIDSSLLAMTPMPRIIWN